MEIKKFIKKWNVAFESKEQQREFAIEMENDIREVVKAYDEFILGDDIIPYETFSELWYKFIKR